MEVMSPVKFAKTAIPDGQDITEWEVYQDVIETDVRINVPIAKHHLLARRSLDAKNLLGAIFGEIDQAAAGALLAGVLGNR